MIKIAQGMTDFLQLPFAVNFHRHAIAITIAITIAIAVVITDGFTIVINIPQVPSGVLLSVFVMICMQGH